MNIYDMLRRKDKNIVATGAELTKLTSGDAVWRGMLIQPGGSILLRDVLRFFPFRERPQHCGWRVQLARGGGKKALVDISLLDPSGGKISQREISVSAEPKLVNLPWPMRRTPLGSSDLRVAASASNAESIFLGVHQVLDRTPLLDLAKGMGVEIGPGAKPQLLPRPGVEVFYLEQMAADEWRDLYGESGKYQIDPSLWDNYRLGEADNLPFENASLDFVFSSHVFEHLANPLGHLGRWHQKLRPGGVILGVVPDLAGTKDALQRPSTLDEILAEYRQDAWAPTLEHYRRYARHNMPDADIEDLFRKRRSIHVHFYTNRNMSELLEEACRQFGFAGFHIQHVDNHKDFHFVLAKPD